MYQVEYEDDILLFLRLMKFLHMCSPSTAVRICAEQGKSTMDDMYVLTEEIIWQIFDDVEFTFDESDETTVVCCSHPLVDRLYKRGRERSKNGEAWTKKIGDIAEYFVLGGSGFVYRFFPHISSGHVILEFTLSPDCYEPLYFANSLIDLLLYCQSSLRRMESDSAETEPKTGILRKGAV